MYVILIKYKGRVLVDNVHHPINRSVKGVLSDEMGYEDKIKDRGRERGILTSTRLSISGQPIDSSSMKYIQCIINLNL